MTYFHCYAFLEPSSHQWEKLYWVNGDETSRKELFDWVKHHAKADGYDLILFDGEIYQYDHGNGKFIKQKWERIEWDEE